MTSEPIDRDQLVCVSLELLLSLRQTETPLLRIPVVIILMRPVIKSLEF